MAKRPSCLFHSRTGQTLRNSRSGLGELFKFTEPGSHHFEQENRLANGAGVSIGARLNCPPLDLCSIGPCVAETTVLAVPSVTTTHNTVHAPEVSVGAGKLVMEACCVRAGRILWQFQLLFPLSEAVPFLFSSWIYTSKMAGEGSVISVTSRKSQHATLQGND